MADDKTLATHPHRGLQSTRTTNPTGTHQMPAAKTIAKWNDKLYVRIYQLAAGGITSKNALAAALGVQRSTFTNWYDTKPGVADAIERAREVHNGNEHSFKDYVFGQLPAPLQKLWEQIEGVDEDGYKDLQIEKILGRYGDRVRQRLFLYAIVCSDFNVSMALRSLNISSATYKRWCEQDPQFTELLQELDMHKCNFYESGLVRLVRMGDTTATIFANKTKNAHRGYGDKKQVDVNLTGQIDHVHKSLDINEVVQRVSLQAGREILRVLREMQEEVDAPMLTLDAPLARVSVIDKDGDE